MLGNRRISSPARQWPANSSLVVRPETDPLPHFPLRAVRETQSPGEQWLFDSEPGVVDGLLARSWMLHRLERVGVVGIGRECEREFAHLAETLNEHAHRDTRLIRGDESFDIVGGGG